MTPTQINVMFKKLERRGYTNIKIQILSRNVKSYHKRQELKLHKQHVNLESIMSVALSLTEFLRTQLFCILAHQNFLQEKQIYSVHQFRKKENKKTKTDYFRRNTYCLALLTSIVLPTNWSEALLFQRKRKATAEIVLN